MSSKQLRVHGLGAPQTPYWGRAASGIPIPFNFTPPTQTVPTGPPIASDSPYHLKFLFASKMSKEL